MLVLKEVGRLPEEQECEANSSSVNVAWKLVDTGLTVRKTGEFWVTKAMQFYYVLQPEKTQLYT